ncbi:MULTISPECIES: DUF1489 domain-containing protein [Thioclava]|uniref:DUF1489 family protein n=1 Tax=Thioclava TaxID=285107 RepID=UPI000997DA6A|nr:MULTISPECIES: DUF1489 domain-containing protein [Thioclava]MAQ38438.1 DUF1489 domain-containing protein [Thioclava sp.]OOY15644.1 lysophospholipase [Thioclava sp. DLFJ4-1]OOY31112.1 lysophospholipase [Thioclava sp. F36-6]|tara:strand:- start:115 stop:540 length:426 start_codon:yes stop_codon:yes gene_type:complete
MGDKVVNLIKLCVGAEKVEDLIAWQASRYGKGPAMHVTRMWPKRADEILNGGSLYWVFKGAVLARQRILELSEVMGADGIARCAIVLDREVVRTEALSRRPFQGWRYLSPDDAPRDLPKGRDREEALPRELAVALSEIGLR